MQQVLDGDAFLFHGVAVADGHRVFEGRIVFSEGFEVHRDAEGGAHFILAAVGITLSTVFQAIGKGLFSLLMSMCRQLIVLLPAAWILSQLGGLNAVWWCFPVAELVSLVLCLMLFRKVDVRMLKPLGQEA